MPVTPFHLGPAVVLEAVCPRQLSLGVFALVQVVIDVGRYALTRLATALAPRLGPATPRWVREELGAGATDSSFPALSSGSTRRARRSVSQGCFSGTRWPSAGPR